MGYELNRRQSQEIRESVESGKLAEALARLCSAAEFQLAPGDCLVLCSAGVAEATNQDGETHGFDRAQEMALQACRSARTAREGVDQILAAVAAYGGAYQSDDVACVMLRVCP